MKKYLSEFAVCLYSSGWIITSANQLMTGGTMRAEEQDIANNCHIYLISKTPSISYCNKSFKYDGARISGKIIYSIEGVLNEKEFEYDFPLLDGAIDVRLSNYPYREIQTIDAAGNVIRFVPASLVCMQSRWHCETKELGDLEVLYVGQAYGDGTRNAFERLSSHSTLQKILAQAQYESPDYEIQILTFMYEPYSVITQFDGRAKNVISDYRDMDRVRDILKNNLTEYEQICLVEAGLIRYFQPKYNEIYKDNFPNDKHKILENCYSLDFSGLIVEIDTEDLMYRLFSPTIKPSYHHICKIDLLDPDKRWGFFHYGKEDGTYIKMPDVIVRK